MTPQYTAVPPTFPMGIMPERIWKQKRADELVDAIGRYTHSNIYDKIVVEWCVELSKLILDLHQDKSGDPAQHSLPKE